MAALAYAMAASGDPLLMGRQQSHNYVCAQCTGRGNETKPVGAVKPKKKEFGAPKQSRKARKKSRP